MREDIERLQKLIDALPEHIREAAARSWRRHKASCIYLATYRPFPSELDDGRRWLTLTLRRVVQSKC